MGLQNLNMKGKTKKILVIVIKWRHRANGLYKRLNSTHKKNNSWQTITYSTNDKYTTLRVAAPKRRIIREKKIKIFLISLSHMRESLAISAPLRTQSLSTVHERQNIYWSTERGKCSDTNAYYKRAKMVKSRSTPYIYTAWRQKLRDLPILTIA